MKFAKGGEAYTASQSPEHSDFGNKRRQALSFLGFVDIERTCINLEALICGKPHLNFHGSH